MLENKSEKREMAISAIGNMLVWYNFALFMPFLPILSKHFFPLENHVIRDMVTLVAMSMGLFMRPVGSVIFGPIGDKIGREKAISLAVLLMAVPTFLIGLLPSYEQIGIWSPILLVLLRTCQGISMGGEYTAAMVHLVEIAPSNRRGFFGCLSDAGSQVGVLLSGEVLLLLHSFYSETEIYNNAWRIPFFFAIILVPFAFRRPQKKVEENTSKKITEKDKAKKGKNTISKQESILSLLAKHKTEVLCTIAITAFSAIAFYTLLNFLPYYLVNVGILSLKDAALCSVIANVCIIASILVSGFLSDLFSRKIFIQLGIICVTAVTYYVFLGDIKSPFVWFICHGVYGIFLGMYYGGRAAFFAESFPKNIRCTGVSISLSLAQAIFGGGISIVLNYCISVSSFLVVLPITVVIVLALFAVTKIEDRTGQELI
ncbi:MAG: MFS transporter [Alphaproteobacteria bacterium]|nr:MFS transporter [Alphaproteobacteria bacterium]